jgi:hypothetical protein
MDQPKPITNPYFVPFYIENIFHISFSIHRREGNENTDKCNQQLHTSYESASCNSMAANGKTKVTY